VRMGFQEIIAEKDLIKVLGISKNVLDHLRRKRRFPYISLTKFDRVYYENDVVEWLKKNSTKRGG